MPKYTNIYHIKRHQRPLYYIYRQIFCADDLLKAVLLSVVINDLRQMLPRQTATSGTMPEGYFPAETFHNAYPSAGMPTGRVFAEWLKDLKEKKGVSACRYRYGKNNRSNF
ncbi:hypothetical protein NCY64_04175 [Phocaeicola vulgatus]|uniref:hypothetical protein n=1 Tax=Phocaeicola vulgatus TaxID=821 RepID=UPI002030BEA4|nr:hypothetical protein [Phocaeicola vulgatus]MCM1763616.1 hypothetical protein [Phocaeicola vulgatus]